MDLLVRNGVLETDAAGMQADAAIGVAARRSIFEVAANGAAYGCELASDLMVAPSVEVHLDEVVAVGMSDDLVVEHGFLGSRALVVVGERFVLLFVAHDVVRERGFRFSRRILHERPVSLVDALGAEELVEACQRFACAREDDHAADGAVQTVHHTKEHFAGFGVAFLDVCFHHVGERRVASLVALDNLAGLLRNDDNVVVFVENFQLLEQ